ncbi:MAG: DNA-binding response regulator [Candidatus Kapaibacterium sp.]|nr:MAG: DNA-binding response regulator [Candidatus Kapabacteria bacterium]
MWYCFLVLKGLFSLTSVSLSLNSFQGKSVDTISIAVVEDREQYRALMQRFVTSKADLQCLGIYASAEEALEQIPSQYTPDIILMDIDLPGISGTEAVRILRQIAPTVEIVMLTIFEDNENVFEALRSGATGYILKTSDAQEVYEAIITLKNGGSPMSDGIARKVVQFFHKVPQKSPLPEAGQEYNLTNREQEILHLLVKGYRYKEIADKIFLSPETIRKHIHNIYKKMEVHTRIDAINKLQG